MSGKLGQSERVAEFKSPLGKDVLALVRFEGTEGLGELFEYHVEALSEDENIDFDKAIGHSCTIKLNAFKGKERIYDGILTEARWAGKKEDFFHYRLVLRPWLWLLGHKADCRIFLDKNVKDIIQDVFTKAGFSDFEFRTSNDYDYLDPKKDLKAPKEASEKYSHSKLEVYDYPGKYDDKGKGEKFAQYRL